MEYHSGHGFSTKDSDNDIGVGHCALDYRGAWWFNKCVTADLNGGILSLAGFVVIGFFGRIGYRYNTQSQRLTLDPMALRFQALPLAFIFLSAFISCIVGAFTLVNIDPKKRFIRQSSKKLGEYEMAPIKPIDPIDQKFVKGATNL